MELIVVEDWALDGDAAEQDDNSGIREQLAQQVEPVASLIAASLIAALLRGMVKVKGDDVDSAEALCVVQVLALETDNRPHGAPPNLRDDRGRQDQLADQLPIPVSRK